MYSNKKEIRHYYRDIRRNLPYVPKEKRNYLRMLRNSLDSFLIDRSNATIEDIYEEFGTLEQICTEYKDSLSSGQLTWSIRRTKIICGFLGLFAIVFVGFAAFFIYDTYTSVPTDVRITTTVIEETEIMED